MSLKNDSPNGLLVGPDAKEAKRQFRLGSVKVATTLVEKLLDAIHEDTGQTREEFLWDKFIHDDDKRIAFEAFRLMLSYRHGKPVERKDVRVDGPAYVAEVTAKMGADEWTQRYAAPKKADQ